MMTGMEGGTESLRKNTLQEIECTGQFFEVRTHISTQTLQGGKSKLVLARKDKHGARKQGHIPHCHACPWAHSRQEIMALAMQ